MMTVRCSLPLLALALATAPAGCSSGGQEPAADPAGSGGEAEQAAQTAETAETGTRVHTFTGFSTPESVLHDAEQDVYFVSNVDGSPLEKDGRGFISRLSPDGAEVALRFIDGATEGVTLNAPKGLAVVGDQLYVADIDTVRVFDRHDGHPLGEIVVPGATFLNDVTVCPRGHIIVTDSGLTAAADGFAPSGTDAIYKVELGAEPVRLAEGDGLERPNGVVVNPNGIFVATFGAADLLELSHEGEIVGRTVLPGGALDGLIELEGGDFLVSSWDASAVFRGAPGGEFRPVIEGVSSPADIGFDAQRGLVLVPLFMDGEVAVYTLP
jgi:sugar lactone lactonase YvrE